MLSYRSGFGGHINFRLDRKEKESSREADISRPCLVKVTRQTDR
jgi:hypothetical protein